MYPSSSWPVRSPSWPAGGLRLDLQSAQRVHLVGIAVIPKSPMRIACSFMSASGFWLRNIASRASTSDCVLGRRSPTTATIFFAHSSRFSSASRAFTRMLFSDIASVISPRCGDFAIASTASFARSLEYWSIVMSFFGLSLVHPPHVAAASLRQHRGQTPAVFGVSSTFRSFVTFWQNNP